MPRRFKRYKTIGLSLSGLIVTLGVVYGDIGTSPLYVLKAIVGNCSGSVDFDFVAGALSCIFWTLTLQTTIKYITITLKADNKGEGGIFALFALLRRKVKWVYVFAIIGGSTLLADGVITPSITVVSAIEGLTLLNPDIKVIPIVLVIIALLFLVQQFGTDFIGKSFGPIMLIWFLMLGTLGAVQLLQMPIVLNAVNPYYAVKFLSQYPGGFVILGAVFLCTTGAEALYLDLGHVGVKNIRISWLFVKTCLVLNYFGQGAWMLNNINKTISGVNPFYEIMPSWFLMTGIVISACAAVIASQALISGSYTLISEAIQLNFWPKVKINYPTNIKGQMYIGSINWILFVCCVFVILFFQKSSNMEAAYGLSNNITMIMTTFLLMYYLTYRKRPRVLIAVFVLTYLTIEISFLIANLHKFAYGGWFTLLLGGIMFSVMYITFNGRKIKNRFIRYVRTKDYEQVLIDLHKDTSIPKYASNLVYFTRGKYFNDVESNILYSIINKQPKRADLYWFIHVNILDEPRTLEYKITYLIPEVLIRIDFNLGFKVNPRINLFFRQVVEELVKNNEVEIISRYSSLRKHNVMGDFKFIVIDRIQNYDFDFKPFEQFIIDIYEVLKRLAITEIKAFGLDTSNVLYEKVPLMLDREQPVELVRKE
jgi:KUP system potassium uptake protein